MPTKRTAKAPEPAPAPPPIPLGPNVADLLAQSRAAHAKSLTLRGRVDSHGVVIGPPNLYDAGQAIQQALMARTDAEQLDPHHTDPAWLADQRLNKGVTSEAMMHFLALYLTPAEARRA